MTDINNITDDELDSAFDDVVGDTNQNDDIDSDYDFSDDVEPETDDFDDIDDGIEDDISFSPLPDEITDEEMQQDGIQENDLVVVNNDGSYVVMGQEIAEKLLSNPDFIEKLDSGFADVEEFSNFVAPLMQGD